MSKKSPAPVDRFAARRARLLAGLDERGFDACLISHTVNVRYLTGFTGSNGTLLLRTAPDGAGGAAATLLTDGRYREQAQVETGAQPHEMELLIGGGAQWLPARLRPGAVLGIESHVLTVEQHDTLRARLQGIELAAAPRLVEDLRREKDVEEIDAIRRACAIGDQAFADLLDWLRPGMTEAAVARRLEHTMRECGAQDRAFESIVAAGVHSARPHHRPTATPLAHGDLVKIDFGALVDGYHSDMTRTVALGETSAQLKDVHALVCQAQAAGRDAVRAGAAESAVDAACRDVISAAGYGEQFVHPTGHGVGLEIHEAPILHAEATGTLGDRMVVTVEPGVYLNGVGGVRIEDTVVTGPGGHCEVLTTSPRELLTL